MKTAFITNIKFMILEHQANRRIVRSMSANPGDDRMRWWPIFLGCLLAAPFWWMVWGWFS